MGRDHAAGTITVQQPAEPSVWCVVSWADGLHERRRYTEDYALAMAYAAAHRGEVVPLTALIPWPDPPGKR